MVWLMRLRATLLIINPVIGNDLTMMGAQEEDPPSTAFFCVCECWKAEQRSPPPPVLLVSMLALLFVEGIH